MKPFYRIARLGVLAVGAACCLVGCQQMPMNAALKSGGAPSTSPAPEGNLTSTQQADMQIAMGRVSERQGDLAAALASYGEALKRNGAAPMLSYEWRSCTIDKPNSASPPISIGRRSSSHPEARTFTATWATASTSSVAGPKRR